MIEQSLEGILLGLVLLSFLTLYRIIWGPHAADRIVGTNVMMTNVILAIIILAHLFQNYTYLDVAFVYVLSAFVGTICVMKSLGKGKLS
ncbi:MAG: cation:proton antiporter [Dethiobacter sp.]|nr:cation:proton antiporter [Dethiobacter sp.]MBS3982262.1 cation:proton antiporter [Dethiobacter sp.]MCL5992661.1 monovalent cation/H+ antiporter complex subunit F [Bacillota bacterium]